MATGAEVLRFLIPTGGYYISNNDFDTIIYDEGVKPVTRAQFEAGFAQYDAWKAEQDIVKAQAKAELLERLGITADEARLLLA
jgi:hypothetical protein